MGHEIVYCTRCQTQLRSPDFDKGAAYRLEGHPYCEKCARQMIATLPEDRVNAILSALESKHDDPQVPPPPPEERGNRTTRIMKALAGNPNPRILTGSTRRMNAAPPGKGISVPLIAGVAVGLLVLVVVAAVGGTRASRPPLPAAARPAPPPVEPPETPPAPDDRPATMIAAAREFARRNPDELERQIALFEEAGRHRHSEEVTAILRELRRKLADRRAAALAPVEKEVRAAMAAQDVPAAVARIAEARTRRTDPEWDRSLDRLSQELERDVARIFAAFRDQAVGARRRGQSDEVRRIQDRVAAWGRPGLSRDLETALAPPAPPPPPVAPPSPAPDPEIARREAAASELFLAAEDLHRRAPTRGEAVTKYCLLLSDFANTQVVSGKRALVAERLESAKDHAFLAVDLRPTGAYRIASSKKAGAAWTAEVDQSAATRAQHHVEASFAALPGIEYSAWAYAGACCAEAFVVHVQGTELTGADPKTREKFPAELGSTGYVTLKPMTSLLKGHAAHGPRKEPAQWQWVSIAPARYATAGEKRLRFFGETQGFSVAWVVVSATRKAHPSEADMRELEKQRPDAKVDPEAILRGGLVAHWRLDEGTGLSAADATGHGHPGSLRNGGAWTAGVIGKALKFDGADDHVDCGANDALNVRKAITLSAWVKCAADPVQWDGVAMKSNNDWVVGYGLFFENRSQIKFFVGNHNDGSALSAISPLEWNHVAGTYEGKRVRIYVNGKEGTGVDRAGEIPPCPEPLLIGRGSHSVATSEFTLNGEIDDVRLYDRALEESEIRALHLLRR